MRLGYTLAVFICALPSLSFAQEAGKSSFFDYSTTELQYQYGDNFKRAYSSENDQKASVYTLQNVNGWKYGDNFIFIDYTDAKDTGTDLYTELYSNFSLGKIRGEPISVGPISDIGILAGVNYSRDAKVVKYLPGMRLSWDIPKFSFLNTDFTGYIDDSRGVKRGGAPIESDSYMVDVNWALPFSLGMHDFSLEGHVEYIGSRHNEFGGEVKSHVLGQPQLRYDLGKTLLGKPGVLFAGVEYQYWHNKLGDDIDENVIQALIVFRL